MAIGGSGDESLAAPSGLEVAPGAALEVPVILGNASDVVGYYLQLSYDSARLTCTDALTRDFAAGWNVQANPQTGQVTVGGYGATPLAGAGTLVRLQLQALPDAPVGALPLTFQYAPNSTTIPVSPWRSSTAK